MNGFILAIDQGTTSTRAIVFDEAFRIRGIGQQEFKQYFPRAGWVEHAPEDLWETTLQTVRAALAGAGLEITSIAAIGITNQRETTLVWERASGKPIHPAIVWQDRRTADMCTRMRKAGLEPEITRKTGLLLDPYFSGTKVVWLLDNVEGARTRAEAGELAFGTVDTWLVWQLTGGRMHVTDATNAARTLFYDIARNEWDEDLLRIFGVPRSMLPEVRDTADDFGMTDPKVVGAAVPISGVAGDQQAATLGQACFEPGMIKATYGTGCFAVLNTGEERVTSKHRLLSTIAYRLDGRTTYALEGSIFVAGASVQWLRDRLGLIHSAEESGALAAQADPDADVYLAPAFTGLGAPWWDPEARGALYGLTLATGRAEIAQAALESVCYQTVDLLGAMQQDWPAGSKTVLRVDGGMVASDFTMQRLADLMNAPVDRPEMLETTALGAAWLAGRQSGVWPEETGFAKRWRSERRFESAMDAGTRERKLAGWREAMRRTLAVPTNSAGLG